MAKILKRTVFGDPVLSAPARRLSESDINSPEIQTLIEDLRHTLQVKKYGVGLAAPQVGQGVALSVVGIKPTPSRPDAQSEDMVIINPEIVKTYGARAQMWEGCISFGTSSRDFPYAKALRWRKIRVRYLDEHGKQHEKDFDGLLAHVLQHEIDHLNGVLFTERIKDPKTLMMMSEYKKHILPAERLQARHRKK
jgi:peptide deformylase